ncbi:hypothetical protein DYD21_07730 [Rhodohalobacter sp. SW132]|nr:hypothetical protein DYD21_07730 [Rhodohalobacter sp. SW132]
MSEGQVTGRGGDMVFLVARNPAQAGRLLMFFAKKGDDRTEIPCLVARNWAWRRHGISQGSESCMSLQAS